MLYRDSLLLIGILFLVSSSGCALTPRGGSNSGQANALDAQLSLARLSERHGKLDFARQIYEGALRRDPESKLAQHRMGVIEARRGRLKEAKKHFAIAMKSGDASHELLSDYGYALYLMDDLDAAEQVLRQVTERDPQHQAAHNNLALVLGEQGRFDESLKEFRMVVNEAEALANLAYVKSQMGDFKEAEQTYHRALAMNEDLRPAAEALIQLAEIEHVIASAPPSAEPIAAPHPPTIEHVASTAADRPPLREKPKTQEDEPAGQPAAQERPGKDRVAAPSLHRLDADVRPVAYVTRKDRPRSSRIRSAASHPTSTAAKTPRHAATDPRRSYPQTAPRTPGRTPPEPQPLPPPFFPGSVVAKELNRGPKETPTASKIESIEYLTPAPRFETSFVDDASAEFPGGSISELLLFEH